LVITHGRSLNNAIRNFFHRIQHKNQHKCRVVQEFSYIKDGRYIKGYNLSAYNLRIVQSFTVLATIRYIIVSVITVSMECRLQPLLSAPHKCHGKSLVNRYRDFRAFILCGSAMRLMETLPLLPGHFFRAQLDNSMDLSGGIGDLMKDSA
jgi:hypothetical protein